MVNQLVDSAMPDQQHGRHGDENILRVGIGCHGLPPCVGRDAYCPKCRVLGYVVCLDGPGVKFFMLDYDEG